MAEGLLNLLITPEMFVSQVALPGLAAYFKAGSVEEREHAELLMEYQNRRGGRVKLAGISMPQMEFGNAEKVRAAVHALYAIG